MSGIGFEQGVVGVDKVGECITPPNSKCYSEVFVLFFLDIKKHFFSLFFLQTDIINILMHKLWEKE